MSTVVRDLRARSYPAASLASDLSCPANAESATRRFAPAVRNGLGDPFPPRTWSPGAFLPCCETRTVRR